MIFKRSFCYATILFPPVSLLVGIVTTFVLIVISSFGGLTIMRDTIFNLLPYGVSSSASLNNLLELEVKSLESFCNSINISFKILRKSMVVHSNEYPFLINLHCVVFQNKDTVYDIKSREIVLVHGVNSGPLFCRNFIKFLVSNGYKVYAIALPGFGQSDINDTKHFLSLSSNELLLFYVSFLKIFINKETLRKPFIIGHSFGGFVSAKFSLSHPNLVKKLILVNCIGFLPTLEISGIYWAMLFKLGFPNRVFRPFGTLLNRFFFSRILGNYQKKQHEILLDLLDCVQTSCSSNYGADIVSKFISFNPYHSHWNVVLFDEMLDTIIDTDLIWGYYDGIIPAHNAKFVVDSLAKLGRKHVSLYFMDGWHSPQDNNTDDFIHLLSYMLKHNDVSNDVVEISQKVRQTFNKACDEHGFSTLCTNETRINIRNMYSQFIDSLGDNAIDIHPILYAIKNQNISIFNTIANEDYVFDFYERIEHFFKSNNEQHE